MTAAICREAGRHRFTNLIPLSIRLAFRDLRGGFSGFTIFLACIALGTGAVGAINSLSASLQDAILREGKALLGGDVEATLIHREATPEQREYLEGFGTVSEVASLRAMAQKPDASAQTLVDLKAVDRAYPLYGAVTLEDERDFRATIDGGGLAVDRALLTQLQIGLGDKIEIGRAEYPVTAIIDHEPDRLSGGPAFGSRIILSLDALRRTGLIEPGSLVRWSYRIKTPGALNDGALRDALNERFPEGGFLLRDANDPSPGIRNTLKRLTEFLTLVGLTAMLTGGIGVANAVAAFVEKKRLTIAAYKALGATQPVILRAFLLEIGMLAGLGLLIGLFIAIGLPPLVVWAVQGIVPVEIEATPQPSALAIAALFGMLTALPFILWPLGRAQLIRPAELLRDSPDDALRIPSLRYRFASALTLLLLASAAVLLSQEKRIALITCAVLLGIFLLFWFIGTGIRGFALRIPRPPRAELALALANIGGPGSLARTVALSLGAGVTLLTAVSLVDASLTNELKSRLPEHAPSHFFIGIAKGEVEPFRELVAREAPQARLSTAPMLRGRIVALRGVSADKVKAPASSEWVLNGDRGITYSEDVPMGSEVVEGSWWKPGYEGEPLVSFEADIARALGLKVGDSVVVNVLGRNITVRIANFRKVRWASLDINFVMIFSPNTLKQAPFNYIATLSWADESAAAESQVTKAVATAFPTVSTIKVRDALEAINGVFAKVMMAVRLAGGVTLFMGALVVAGALITAQRRRIREAVILRSLGASRTRIISAHLLEYLFLAVGLSVAAAILGLIAAYAVVTQIMSLSFNLSLLALLQPSISEAIFMLVLGIVGTFRVLSARPAHYLRSE